MAENENGAVVSTETNVTDNAQPNIDDLMAQIASYRAEAEKLKATVSKANSEAANYKNQLRQKMTDDEKAEAERAEAQRIKDEEYANAVNELNRLKATNSYASILVDDKAIDGIIEAVANADHSAIAKIITAEKERAVREAEAKWVGSRPEINTGSTGGSMTKEQIMAIKDNTLRQKAISENIDLFY